MLHVGFVRLILMNVEPTTPKEVAMSIESEYDLIRLKRVGLVVVTVAMPRVSDKHRRLCNCAQQALHAALKVARAGRPINTIGKAIERVVTGWGFSVVPELSGHGIGRVIHEAPNVLNYYHPRDNALLTEGLVITIEPIICSGSGEVFEDLDGWTMKTVDGSIAAHFEHTLVITRGKPVLLTAA